MRPTGSASTGWGSRPTAAAGSRWTSTSVGQAVLNLGGGLDSFLKSAFNHPTLAECYKVAAYDAANKLFVARGIDFAD